MKHPPGVLRAAKIIASESIDIETSANHFAEIIDRETGAHELLRFLKDMAELANSNRMCDWPTLEKARAAIAKAEARQ